MKTYARVVNGHAVDVTVTADITALFHAEIAAQFIVVPDGTEDHARLVDGQWLAPVPPEAANANPLDPAVEYPILEPLDFYLAFTVAERRAIKSSTVPDVVEFWNTYERCEAAGKHIDPNRPSVRHAVAGLVALNIIGTNRVPDILAGIPQ